MDFLDLRLTNDLFWRAALVVAAVEIPLILGIRRLFPASLFRRISGWITWCSFLFYAALWSWVLGWAWDGFYALVFPAWVRSAGLVWGVAYGAAGLGLWWLGGRLPGNPAVNFCLLGGLEGFLSHLWAINGMGIIAKTPLLQGVDPLPVLVFAILEKAFYWILILLLSAGFARLTRSDSRQTTITRPL